MCHPFRQVLVKEAKTRQKSQRHGSHAAATMEGFAALLVAAAAYKPARIAAAVAA
jgi:hypothetical protein